MHDFKPIFDLSDGQVAELIEYITPWSVLRRCCGTQMSATYRAILQTLNTTSTSPCSTYDIDEAERFVMHHRLSRVLGHHILSFNRLSDNDGAFTGDYCRRASSAISTMKLPFNADLTHLTGVEAYEELGGAGYGARGLPVIGRL